jgi:hypothetical protein
MCYRPEYIILRQLHIQLAVTSDSVLLDYFVGLEALIPKFSCHIYYLYFFVIAGYDPQSQYCIVFSRKAGSPKPPQAEGCNRRCGASAESVVERRRNARTLPSREEETERSEGNLLSAKFCPPPVSC